jgi:hypothetical protein
MAFAVAAAVSVADPARALKPQVRNSWLVGVSYGYSEGHITWGDGSSPDRRLERGATPQIRVGKMLSPKFALGLDYHGWMLEAAGREQPEESAYVEAVRSSLQSVTLTGTWYPGGGGGTALDGFYVRGGAGFAWAGLTFIDIDKIPPDKVPLYQEHGERTDETGLGLNLQVGYEFRISHNFAAGLGLGFHYLSLGKDIYDSAYYLPGTLTGIWYW